MITVCVLFEAGQPVGFIAQGHAGFAEHGSDIVCSAVSALTQTTVLGLTELLKLDVGLSIDENGMHCILSKDATAHQIEQAALLLNTMLLGLESIANSYNDYLRITQREV